MLTSLHERQDWLAYGIDMLASQLFGKIGVAAGNGFNNLAVLCLRNPGSVWQVNIEPGSSRLDAPMG